MRKSQRCLKIYKVAIRQQFLVQFNKRRSHNEDLNRELSFAR